VIPRWAEAQASAFFYAAFAQQFLHSTMGRYVNRSADGVNPYAAFMSGNLDDFKETMSA